MEKIIIAEFPCKQTIKSHVKLEEIQAGTGKPLVGRIITNRGVLLLNYNTLVKMGVSHLIDWKIKELTDFQE